MAQALPQQAGGIDQGTIVNVEPLHRLHLVAVLVVSKVPAHLKGGAANLLGNGCLREVDAVLAFMATHTRPADIAMEVPERITEAIEAHDCLGEDVDSRAGALLSVEGLPERLKKETVCVAFSSETAGK
jgi:hypothetical protein